jgi:ribosome-associated translation inhibitor RaiA
MRVYVSSLNAAVNPQILAYAEYRIFAALARYSEVRQARVVLRSQPGGAVKCSVTIEDADGSTRASAKGLQAAAAVDRAAERVSDLMRATADRRAHREADRDPLGDVR